MSPAQSPPDRGKTRGTTASDGSAWLVDEAASVARQTLGRELVGVYLYGSLATDDFVPGVSDVDLLLVAARALAQRQKAQLVSALLPMARFSRTAGLELFAVTANVARHPGPRPTAALFLACYAGDDWQPDVAMQPSPEAKLLLVLASVRANGRVVSGRAPEQVMGTPPRWWLLHAARAEIDWWLAADRRRMLSQPAYARTAVLNACRAQRLASDGKLVSKFAAGRWARRRLRERALVDAALQAQQGDRDVTFDADAVTAFLWQSATEVLAAESRAH